MLDPYDLDAIRGNVARILEKRGLSRRRMPKSADLGETYGRDFVNSRSKDFLFSRMVRLADYLDCRLSDLLGAKPSVREQDVLLALKRLAPAMPEDQARHIARHLPPALGFPVVPNDGDI